MRLYVAMYMPLQISLCATTVNLFYVVSHAVNITV